MRVRNSVALELQRRDPRGSGVQAERQRHELPQVLRSFDRANFDRHRLGTVSEQARLSSPLRSHSITSNSPPRPVAKPRRASSTGGCSSCRRSRSPGAAQPTAAPGSRSRGAQIHIGVERAVRARPQGRTRHCGSLTSPHSTRSPRAWPRPARRSIGHGSTACGDSSPASTRWGHRVEFRGARTGHFPARAGPPRRAVQLRRVALALAADADRRTRPASAAACRRGTRAG